MIETFCIVILIALVGMTITLNFIPYDYYTEQHRLEDERDD